MSTNFGNFGLPSYAPIGTIQGSEASVDVPLNQAWYRFLARLSQLTAERPLSVINVGDSPFTYTATTIGHVSVRGGTVSSKLLSRGSGNVTVDDQLIPVAAGDQVTVTYTVLPTMHFIPGARA